MEARAGEHKYSEARCEVALAPSRRAALLVASAALATELLIAGIPGDAALRILAATWIACAALHAVHARCLLRGPRAVRAILLERDGTIEVADALGRRVAGRVREGSFVAPWLTIVRWQPTNARRVRTIPVIPGMAAAEDLRRLRVLLRWP